MSNSFFSYHNRIFIFAFIFIILVCFLFTPFVISDTSFSFEQDNSYSFDISSSGYVWPAPGYTTITSYFGKRFSPTSGASSYHKGIDIGASKGASLIAITSGKITYTGFFGGGGYTITLTCNNIKITYCHVSPTFIVKVGDIVEKGQIIGYVGPKNVYGVKGNPYKDSNGNPTNGATTGPHLHLGVRVNGEYIDPLSLFN